MKYEFHVGDYVETVGGFVGWVCKVRDDGYIWVANKDVAPCSYRMPEQFKYFNRIGQYDFTKKDEDKIEPLCDNYTESFPIFKTHNTFTGKTYKQECYSIDMGVMSKKINELVEAVNKLRDKRDKND